MKRTLFCAASAVVLAAALALPAGAASVGTCQAAAPEIDIGSASSLMAGYDPMKGVPSHQTVPVTVTWTITTLAKSGASVTVDLSSPTGTLLDPSGSTPLSYSVYYGSNSNGSLFANGSGGTAHYSTVTSTKNGHDTFQINAVIGASQSVRVSHTPLSYADSTLHFTCTVG